MTKAEAFQLFNQLEDEDDILEFYEDQLFEYKKFFLSKAPISKLFESRTRKLAKLGEAYSLLSDSEKNGNKRFLLWRGIEGEESSNNILDTYKSFQKQKNEIKRLISNAASTEELIHWVQLLIDLEKQNAAYWETILEKEDDIIVSKEPDPMYLLEAINLYNQREGETFEQLKNLENNPPEILIQEMKRLSLLFKKF